MWTSVRAKEKEKSKGNGGRQHFAGGQSISTLQIWRTCGRNSVGGPRTGEVWNWLPRGDERSGLWRNPSSETSWPNTRGGLATHHQYGWRGLLRHLIQWVLDPQSRRPKQCLCSPVLLRGRYGTNSIMSCSTSGKFGGSVRLRAHICRRWELDVKGPPPAYDCEPSCKISRAKCDAALMR